jgi:hypothetical protein
MNLRRRVLRKQNIFTKIKNQFIKSKAGKHTIHVLNCLRYLLFILIAGIVIHKSWNAMMILAFKGEYQISMFEAAILWACVF